jgi:hypothetical protein
VPALAAVLLGGLGIAAFVVFQDRDPNAIPPDRSPPHGPATVEPRASPALAPGVWNPLLEREPVLLRWPAPGKNSYRHHRREQRELVLSSEGLGLLGLGETTAPAYRLAATMQQNPWTGNVGLFFGYQDRVFEGNPAQFYQLVELVAIPQPKGGPLFRLDWKTVHCAGPPQHEASHLRGVSPTFGLSAGEHRLELAVGRKGLEAVSWDGKVLPRPSAAVVLRPPPPADYRGQFGLYVRLANGVFREAVYLYEEVR